MNANILASKVGRYPSWQQLQDAKISQKNAAGAHNILRAVVKFAKSL